MPSIPKNRYRNFAVSIPPKNKNMSEGILHKMTIKNFLIRLGMNFIPLSLRLITCLVITSVLAACSMIDEDLEPCAPPPNTYTVVDFVYDYNMQYTDLFTDHVGSVYLYVFDSKGIFQYRREKNRLTMTDNDFSIRFDTTEIKPGHTYQFVAVASANHAGYESILETPGFTLQTEMIPGVSTIDDYIIKLDRDDDGRLDFGVVNFKDAYGNNTEMMDTLWTTKPDEVQIVNIPTLAYKPSPVQQPDVINNVTVPMMRITNSITVNLKGAYFNENVNENDYTILIHFPHGNGTLDFTGSTQPAQELYYTSLRKRVVNFSEATRQGTRAPGDQYGIESIFGVSRLQVNDESSLQLREADTNNLITQIPDFSEFLASAFDHGCDDDQEFLDREYEFNVDLYLDKEGQPVYAIISIEVLGWEVRINFINDF